MKKILFITHNTSRSGAPLVVLYFMQWLKAQKNEYEIDCLSLGDGALDMDFENVSSCFYRLTSRSKVNMIERVLCKISNTTPKKKYQDGIVDSIKKVNYDIVYANTVASLKWGVLIKNKIPRVKLLLHLHELEEVIKAECPRFNDYKQKVDFWICASTLVLSNLVEKHNVSSAIARRVYEFSKLPRNLSQPQNRKLETPFIIGGSGGVNRRKGYDFFIAIAKVVKERYPNLDFRFQWVGKFPNKRIQAEVENDISKAGLKHVVIFSGETINPLKLYKAFDLFLMTSREDPFPLVCIEVGSLGKPIVCFKGATGTEEILKQGGGKIVSYLSINEMANAVINYANDAEELYADSLQSQLNFKAFTIENQSPKIFEVINSLLDE